VSPLESAARYLVPEPAEIVEKISYGPEIHAYRLRLRDPAARRRFDFMPGQFNMVYAPGVGEIAVSIASDPEDEDLEHIIRIVGRTTRVIDRLETGDVLGIRGPYGEPWPLQEARWKNVLVVTGGLGSAPVIGALDYMFRRRANYGRITVLHGVKRPSDLIHRDRFEAWRRQDNTEIHLASDQPDRAWRERTGRVTDLFADIEFEATHEVAFLCGPEVMIDATLHLLERRGISEDRVFVSMERNMKCAVGLCGHCQFGPQFVCKDGPVFPYRRIAPFLGVPGI
jgi:sulfhydrogenase subunit gamma (sulfur reductase)